MAQASPRALTCFPQGPDMTIKPTRTQMPHQEMGKKEECRTDCPNVFTNWPDGGFIVEIVFSMESWSHVSCIPGFVKWTFYLLHICISQLKKMLVEDVAMCSVGTYQLLWPLANDSNSLCLSLHICRWEWGLYCSLFDNEMEYCVFPSAKHLISIQCWSFHFLTLTPGRKHGEGGYRYQKENKELGEGLSEDY